MAVGQPNARRRQRNNSMGWIDDNPVRSDQTTRPRNNSMGWICDNPVCFFRPTNNSMGWIGDNPVSGRPSVAPSLNGITVSPTDERPSVATIGESESQRPWFTIYTAFMAIQVGILALHFQGMSSSPFKTHPAEMWTFVLAMFTNVGAALYYGHSKIAKYRRFEVCDLAGYISGSLASAAFLSILVPRFLVALVFVIWVLHLPIYFDAARNWIFNHLSKIWNVNGGNNEEGVTNPAN